MIYGDIKFSVRKNLNEKDFLSIRLEIKEVSLGKEIQFYKGKAKIENIRCKEKFYYDSNFIYVNSCNSNLILEYDVLIGGLGKHGKGGELSSDLITFMGEQILLLPVEMLTMNDNSKFNGTIEIDFSKFVEILNFESFKEKYLENNNLLEFNKLNEVKHIIPFKEENFRSRCKNATWSDLYEIMKSSYTFGYFEKIDFKESYGNISIYNNIENTFLSEDETKKEKLIRNIKGVCDYYFNLFKINSFNKKDINIALLRKSKKENPYILGGSGKNIISATFDMDNKRDWQLLSHRLFHAFMDHVLKSRDYHLPPNLWLTEGLATYYENLALETLEEDLKESLEISFKNEMASLYTRYLYMTLKEPSRFRVIPMEEASIRSHGKIEFLHYTKAPLMIFYIEELGIKEGENNKIINYLVDNKKEKFSMQNLFYRLLGEQCNAFASNYLFGNGLIPLWNLKKYLEDEKVIDYLEEYEYILWTWFLGEDENYVKDEVKSYKKEFKNFLNNEEVNIYNSYITKEIEEYSNTLSFLLKIWILRAKLCNISCEDINIRYKLLEDKMNLSIWNDFMRKNMHK
ncbi:hypothetical protein [Clostridium sp. LIBA-8841]|uniref:hypothetical protein n=1 Tax=Clostridium sp. LIBA-8841 TaxID=2987530 RepID=UPI002AC60207|nr:hypothetical protein [Clostridium sp. LIBA-8841]MDZ5253393.1 hypothetical protein [Clostridium sp. LIBA-8841]